jgi:hypothetical protein
LKLMTRNRKRFQDWDVQIEQKLTGMENKHWQINSFWWIGKMSLQSIFDVE